jgi:tRNA threonylcarbamoyladenosine biosynthesis protein TsaB
MLILTIRTDKPQAELGLYNDASQLNYMIWHADRQLAETIHKKLKELLESQSMNFINIQAVVIFKGPGSFTGLRIGISVANALADGLKIPIVGTNQEDWIQRGIELVSNGKNEHIVLPEYGSPPHITKPKK